MTRFTAAILACCLAACTSEPLIPDNDAGPGDAGPADAATADAGQPDAGPQYDVFFDEGMGPEVAEQFASATTSPVAPPEIIYPESGILVPPNMFGVDIHFRTGVTQAFEVTFAQGGAPSVVAYIRCAAVADGCIFQPWREVWQALADRRSAGPYDVRIRALAGDGASAPSEPFALELADEEIHGGLYYYSSDDYPPSIRRHELGLARRSAELFINPESFVASHSISRDGSRIAIATLPDTGGSFTPIYDVVTRAPIGEPIVSPEGLVPRFGPEYDMVRSANGADTFNDFPIQIISGTDGSVLQEWHFGAAHSADWSPDGHRIVFDVTTGLDGFRFIYEVKLLEQSETGEWQEPRTLETPDTLGAYQPSFAPDSDWIGFTAVDLTDVDEATRTPAPILVALRASDGRMVQLSRALGQVSRFGEQPFLVRWNPSPYTHQGRRIFWLTYATSRPCGLLPEADEGEIQGKQIWMAAFDPEADPDDPSHPAFRVPAQRWGLDNSMGEWALTVRRQPCTTDDECPEGNVCLDGFCYESPQ